LDVKGIGIKFIGGLFVSFGAMDGLAIAATYIADRAGPLLLSIATNTPPQGLIVSDNPTVIPYLVPLIAMAIGLTLLTTDCSSLKK